MVAECDEQHVQGEVKSMFLQGMSQPFLPDQVCYLGILPLCYKGCMC
jgi:hypothetical protein